jgi:predicted amidophosphoribosyltransferase
VKDAGINQGDHLFLETEVVQPPVKPEEEREKKIVEPKFCGQCGKPLRAGSKFCLECGAPIRKR